MYSLTGHAAIATAAPNFMLYFDWYQLTYFICVKRVPQVHSRQLQFIAVSEFSSSQDVQAFAVFGFIAELLLFRPPGSGTLQF